MRTLATYLADVIVYQVNHARAGITAKARAARARNWLGYRDWHAYAYALGFYERATEGVCAGRTHEDDMDWNESYDRGMNLADRLEGVTA